jgi:uncharacterized repeat protein (TIGR02543 family)
MKKFTLLLLLFVTFINTSYAQSPLCASTASSFCCEYIESVTINGVATTRSGVTFNSGPGYNDYTGSVLTNMVAGNTYPVSVVVKTNSSYQEFVKIWFDFNGNGDLNDAGELIFDQVNTFNGTFNYTGNITVPATAFNGDVYLRVVMVYSSSPTLCGAYDYGNTMDFKVNVTGGVTPATLNVTTNNLGGTGKVVSSPAGINTGTGLDSANYSLNSSVTLTATPDGTYKFIGWTGDATGTTNPLTVTMDASKNIVANFGPSNSVPTISAISNISTCPGTVSVGPTSFTIGDVETATTSLVVTATSSNQTLVPNANLTLGGTGANRTITITPAVGQQGTATITVNVADTNGGSTSTTYNIAVQDLISPTVVTKNIVIGLDSAGLATIIAAQIENGSTDNCGISSMSVAPNSFTCANIGSNTVILSVVDTKGNVATGTATVTVEDKIVPTAVAKSLTVQLDTSGNANITAAQINNASSDACGIKSLSVAPNSFTCANIGNNTVTLTVTDNNDNVSTTTSTVTVEDILAPTIATASGINVNADSGVCTYASSQLTAPTTADNCSVATMVASPTSLVLGSNIVTWTATDGSGNTETSTQTVTVVDAQNPTIATLNSISVNADAGSCTYASSQLTAPTAADNCNVASVVASPASLDLGENTVTWTVTDGAGLTKTSTQTVTVIDAQNPTITAPADVAGNVNSSCVATTVVLGAPVTADNCTVVNVTNNAPATFSLGDTTVTWTVTDGSGNTATATQLVSVGDTILPVVKTKNATVYLNNLGQAIVTPAMIDNGTTDNCDFSLIVSPNNFVCGNVGVNNVILIATDAIGNQTIKPAFVTVVDNTPPTITAPSAVSAIANASCGATGVALGTPVTTDNCFIDTPAVNDAPATFPLGATTVTWTVTDRNGNSATATQIVTVLDTENPTIATLAATSVNADTDVCTYASSQLTKPAAADNCSVASIVASPASLVLGSNTVTWTVTDGSGLTATSTQTVTVLDNQKPFVATSDIMVALDSSGHATITAAMINAGSTDNCSIDSYSLDITSFNCSHLGDVEVTLTVTDSSGNSSSNTALVTVVDILKPSIVTLDPISVNADAGICTYDSSQLTKPSALDNCSVATVVASPTSLVLGSNIVTWTATDGSGNTETSTQTVTVVDTQNPTIVTLDAINVNADSGICTYASSQLTAPTAADNCSVASVVASPASLDLGENTVTWTVTDGAGLSATSTQTITVVDAQKPTIATLDPISVNADAGVCTYASSQLTAPAALDNCSVATVVASPESIILGDNTVTWTVTDGSGNTETSIQTVTVVDTQKPTLVTLDPISVNADSGVCTYASLQLTAPAALDNCSVASVVASPASLDLGGNTVTWTVTDGAGLTETSVQIVTVVDAQNPTIVTLDAINVNADSGVCTYASSQLNAPTAADNCSVATVAASPASLDLGDNTVTWTVTDGAGLSATSTQTITVVDAQKPTIATLDPISVNADSGVCTYASSQLTAPAAIDNCSVATVVASPESLILGDNTVTWTVTDGSGNTETSIQTVTVIDTQKPTLVTLDPISVNADSGVCTMASSQLTAPAALDNCSVASVVASPASLDLGENTVTWTVTDGAGLTETSVQIVTVVDAQIPTIATLDPISVNADSGVCTYESSQLTAPTAADNCSVAIVAASPTTLVSGANTVTWAVTDGAGLTATSTQTVTVLDSQKPTIATVDVVVSANASCNATGVDLGTPTTADNCSVASVTSDAPTTFPLGDTTVTWTVTDGSGNTATATQTVTVEDTILPTITAPADVNGNVNASCGANGVVIGNAITADNCSVALVTNDAPVIFPLGETTVTWTVTDGSGNTATATQLVTMGDTIFPVVKAKNATVYLNSTGQAIILPSMIDNGTTDNCDFTLTVSPNNLVCANIGQNNVLLIATDASGNQSFKPATITLVDNLNPTITAPSNVSANANASCSATGIVLGSPLTSDNCYIDTPAVNNAPATFPIGVTTVTWTVTDRSGNTATANQTVTVTDAALPIVITKNITIQLDASGNATITAADIDNGSSDNCGISAMVLSQDTFTISDIGIQTITLTVTDNSGNTSSATAQVTVDGTLKTAVPKSSAFLIYPMPFDSHINITLPDSYIQEVIYIQVYDLSGRAVYNQKHAVENHNVTINDLKRFSDGSYYINLLDSNQNVIQSKHILKKSAY